MKKVMILAIMLFISPFTVADSPIKGKVKYIEDELVILGSGEYKISHEVEVVTGQFVEEPISLPAIPVGAEVILYQASSGPSKDMVIKIQMIGPSYLIQEARQNLP